MRKSQYFPFGCSVLNKGATGTIFIMSLVWRGPWLGIEPGTSRIRSQHSTTRLSRRRCKHDLMINVTDLSYVSFFGIHCIEQQMRLWQLISTCAMLTVCCQLGVHFNTVWLIFFPLYSQICILVGQYRLVTRYLKSSMQNAVN